MVTSKVYNTVAGLWVLYAPELAYVTPLWILREGKGHDITLNPLVAPVNRQVFYHNAGKLVFDSSLKFNPGETIQVVWKHN